MPDITADFIRYAYHLRYDHGFSRRKVAERLGVTEYWVRQNIENLRVE
jgi:DNA-binding transcriptional regulator LsrR (DeoR family)